MISVLFVASLISGFNKDATHTFSAGKSPPVIHVTDLYDGYPISEILMRIPPVRELDSIQYIIVVNNNTQADFQAYIFAYDISLKTFLSLHLTIRDKSVPFQLIQYNPFHEFKVYPIKLAAAKADTVSLKLLAGKNSFVQMISKPESIPDFNPLISFEIKGNYFELWICGMLLMMALYVGANFFQIRNREYFYYLCYVVFIFLYFLFLTISKSSVVFYSNSVYRFFSQHFLQTVSIIFYFQFVRFFLRTPSEQPAFDRVLRIASFAGLLYIVADGIILFLFDNHNLAERFWFAFRVAVMAFTTICLAAGVWRSRSPIRNYLICGTIFMISGGALSMYFNLRPDLIWGPKHPLYGNLLYFRAGVVLEVLFFSMGLGYKHKLDEKNKILLETQLQSKREELKRANELDELKSKLFANISHEFRTPLTLIMGPLKQMLSRQQLDIQGLTAAVNNSERLHRLISQLLDLSRFDAGKMTLEKTTSDFLSFLRRVTSSFSTLGETKGIMFRQTFPPGYAYATFDHDKIEKILYNVLSNAFKFTPSGGEVNITVTEGTNFIWEIVIADNGKGIPNSDLKHIFERFNRSWAQGLYQYEGSGIGLALTHELIKIMGGQISVQSEPGKGSVFTIVLPIEKSVADPGKISLPDINYSISNNQHSGEDVHEEDLPLSRQSILIVEDNAELLRYIGSCLKNQYHIMEARNGRQGLVISIDEVPDLIISDLMMPEMDGIEFCAKIRNHEATAHIPFIMLTARADEESKIKGLDFGADDYLVKPFNMEELTIKVKNIMERRRMMQERIWKLFVTAPEETDVASSDEQFLIKLKGVIEQRMADPQLSVESLSEDMALSRVQLYRKVLSLTGVSGNKLIQSIRLQKAAQLLDKNTGTISEIAYQTGFNSLSYFTKCFKKEFGKTPSEYAFRAN